MPTARSFTFALAAAAIVATGATGWHHDASTPPRLPTKAVHETPSGVAADVVYLPDLFIDAERVAPIEPLPPQF
ncbi:hypothetical protein ACPWT1_22355 [Ramlibacter sp. MMS24-I3-19]|uniref:hypothetical protein n=1 Tax=Ramlibacter sp. MMS24-I3-19 TaxID=3416606 RepID=UPI003D0776B3